MPSTTTTQTHKIDFARKMIEAFPDTPTRTLAKMLVAQYPDVFTRLEQARSCVNTAKGTNGVYKRANVKPTTFTVNAKALAEIEAGIPDETEKELIPYPIELGLKYLILSDIHIPVHSKLAIETAVAFGVKQGCNALLENGDITEHAATSKHPKGGGVPGLIKELEGRTAYMKWIRPKFKKAYYTKLGNHENNVARYINDKAPELSGLPQLEFESLMGFKNYGIECIDSTRVITAGKISGIHGHEYKTGGDLVNPARWLALRFKDCCFCSHFHRSSTHTERRGTGFETVYYSTGCLRMRTPDWNPLNNWNWGMAILETFKNGDFLFNNYRILSRGEVVSG